MSRKRSHDALEAYRERFIEGAAEKGVDAEIADTRLRQARRLLGLRLPEGARGRVRAPRVPVDVAAPLLPGGVPVRAPERAADGLLPARDARSRRAAPRGGGAPVDVNLSGARCVVEWGSGADRPELHLVDREGRRRGARRRARRERAVSGRRRPRAPVAALLRRARGAREGRRLRRLLARSRDLLWELGLVFRAQSVPGTDGEMKQLPLELEPTAETPALRDLTRWERMLADYRHTSMSIETHPLALLRPHLPEGTLSSEELHATRHGRQVAFAGMTVARQRPSTAKGIVFMLLEDEHGQVNLIVPSGDLRAAPRDGARRAAHPRAWPLRAGGGEPQRPRLVARVAASPARARRVATDDTGGSRCRARTHSERSSAATSAASRGWRLAKTGASPP